MEINIDQLLKGKGTKIRDKEYYQTEAYVTPFMERLQPLTNDFRVKVELPKQVTITRQDDLNFDDITYNRVWIQAVLPEEYSVENHSDVIGMVYGLDTRKPIVKFYRGGLNKACTNLCVFDPAELQVQELGSIKAINYKGLDSIKEHTNNIKNFLEKLHSIVVPYNEVKRHEQLGRWIDNCIDCKYDNGLTSANIGVATAISAYKQLFKDAKSPYYVNGDTDMFNIYNSFTEIISNKDKDIINECEKILLLRNILDI